MFSLIQKKAPNFIADAVSADGSISKVDLSKYIGKKYIVLFFYPLDFTFVCPTEIISLSKKHEEFEKRNVEVFGISVDSHFSHANWRNIKINEGGIGNINFTLISDLNKDISKNYGLLINNSVSLRGTYIIDLDGIVRHITLNDLFLGRNIDEIIRNIDSIQFHEKNGEVCPANWKKGDEGIIPNEKGIKKYLSENI